VLNGIVFMKKDKNNNYEPKSDFGTSSGIQVENDELNSLKIKILGMLDYATLKEVSDVILEESKRLTSSENCYVAYVDPDNRDSVGISFSHMTGGCQMYADMGEARFKIREDGTYGGLLGYSLDTGESFYIHNPSLHPAAHGLPEGHVPVNEFLSVPVKYNDKIIGQIVLGNPKKSYTPFEVDITDVIANIYGQALHQFLYKKNNK
jgi:GAF domain-containing protein